MSLSRTGTIEGEFAGLTPLRFSPPVEARFETEGLSERIRLAQATLFAAIFLYDIFLLELFPAMLRRDGGWGVDR
ncbi:UNVERIFIED_ORG: hypothetical protein J2W74_002668 [Methylorubrum zatmanii]